ncbi:MAG: hypothetical protein CGW95_04765 [Phenylobacterium zucineum]|nr:MAG: hypothetical protein CGW95_04765 [Phenylobacterium zucineum]
MTISVITPVHAKAAPYIQETYASLVSQTFGDWEWVIMLNGGGTVPGHISADSRVKVFNIDDDDETHNKIGRLKGTACSVATGEILVELDADDILVPTALDEVALALPIPTPSWCIPTRPASRQTHGKAQSSTRPLDGAIALSRGGATN